MVVVAVLAMMVPTCTALSPEASGEAWRGDGYGWIYSLSGDQLHTYEATEISCLLSRTLEHIEPSSRTASPNSAATASQVRPCTRAKR